MPAAPLPPRPCPSHPRARAGGLPGRRHAEATGNSYRRAQAILVEAVAEPGAGVPDPATHPGSRPSVPERRRRRDRTRDGRSRSRHGPAAGPGSRSGIERDEDVLRAGQVLQRVHPVAHRDARRPRRPHARPGSSSSTRPPCGAASSWGRRAGWHGWAGRGSSGRSGRSRGVCVLEQPQGSGRHGRPGRPGRSGSTGRTPSVTSTPPGQRRTDRTGVAIRMRGPSSATMRRTYCARAAGHGAPDVMALDAEQAMIGEEAQEAARGVVQHAGDRCRPDRGGHRQQVPLARGCGRSRAGRGSRPGSGRPRRAARR